jgi:two-component system LytT family response regulator
VTPDLLRVIVADDERPARRFLMRMVRNCAGVELAGEAGSGEEAIRLIERTRPDLALLDLQMPEIGGLDVARHAAAACLPLVAFVTAFDDCAIEAFELNAIDYILKPARQERVQATIDRARQRLVRPDAGAQTAAALANAAAQYERAARRPYLDRIPVRCRDEVLLLSVRQIAFVAAEGELVHIHTRTNERYTISHRLHALAARLDPRRFIRLGRGTIANVDLIAKVSPMPGGTAVATLTTGSELQVSRIQTRVLRETLLKI